MKSGKNYVQCDQMFFLIDFTSLLFFSMALGCSIWVAVPESMQRYMPVGGGSVHGVDFNELALSEFRDFAKSRGLDNQIEIEHAPLHTWDPVPNDYDFAISDGVIHHTPDPEATFCKLVKSAKPGGFVAFSTAPLPGGEQRLWMRKIIQRFEPTDVQKAVALAAQLFPEYMDRATRLGKRTPEQVVSDNFMLIQNVPLPVIDVLRWLDENGVSLYRSWLSLELANMDPASLTRIQLEKSPWREQLAEQAKAWASQRYLMTDETDQVTLRTQLFEAELTSIHAAFNLNNQRALEELKRILPACRVFGRGTCGVGEWWVVGVKQ